MTPIDRNTIREDDGKSYKVFSTQNPHFYKTKDNVLLPINLDFEEDKETPAGQIKVKSKNIKTFGWRKDGSKNKVFGFRPDTVQDGTQQLEYTLNYVKINGQEVAIDLGKQKKISSIIYDFGDFISYNTRQRNRIAYKSTNTVRNFEINFTINLVGLIANAINNEIFIRDSKGNFAFKIAKPVLLDNDFNEIENTENYVEHSFNISGSVIQYSKRSTTLFSQNYASLPSSYLIDADTVYGATSDGRIISGTKSTWDLAHDATSGTAYFSESTQYCAVASRSVSGYAITRGFFLFDLSGVTGSSPTSVGAYIYGNGWGSAKVSLQKSSVTTTIANGDYDAFTGSYYDVATSWTTGGYNELLFDSTGISDISGFLGGATLFSVCTREYDHDYLDSAMPSSPYTSYGSDCFYADAAFSNAYDPYLIITFPATSFIPKIIIM